MLCIIAGIYKLISKTVPIIDFYDIDDVLKFLVFVCVVKTHLCSYFTHDGYDYFGNRRAHTINVWAMDCCIGFTQENVGSAS